jgi:hypothetical protein
MNRRKYNALSTQRVKYHSLFDHFCCVRSYTSIGLLREHLSSALSTAQNRPVASRDPIGAMADFALGFWRKALLERSTPLVAGGAGRPWRSGFLSSLGPLGLLRRSGPGQALTARSAASPYSSAYDGPACEPVSGVQHTRPPRPQSCQKTPGYCWSFYFHVTRLRLLRWLLEIFGPSTKACARQNFRRLGLTNSIRALSGQCIGMYISCGNGATKLILKIDEGVSDLLIRMSD